MEISRYLAITAAEMAAFSPPEGWQTAYMACHFSPYGTGLSNLPSQLPPESMLILNDRTPIRSHAPERIAAQLREAWEQLGFQALLLDFQRPDSEETAALCARLGSGMPFPVGVSEPYAKGLDCPVFLPPVSADRTVEAHLTPWQGREVWLDLAPEAVLVTLTEDASCTEPISPAELPKDCFWDEALCCRYRAEVAPDAIRFRLWRDLPCLEALAEKAAALGATRFVGLYQELVPDWRFESGE